MKRQELFALFLIGLLFNICIAWFQLAPGYMDADYYYAGGLRLVQGHGFTETYLWNYLDNPQVLPHASHGYWFPLASIIAAAGMYLTGQHSFWAARLGFIVIAALASPVSALLGFKITAQRGTAIAAGLLAVFSGYHAPFMPTTDNFGLFMLLGGLFFLFLPRSGRAAPFLLGFITGLMNLSRVDGLMWFVLGCVGLFFLWLDAKPRLRIGSFVISIMIFSIGYALVMAPWMARNIAVWGTPLTPAGSNVIWMTRYDETFAWPASRINMQNWLATGWQSALESRLTAFKLNSINTIGAQSAFLLFPFILIGLWALRKDLRIRLAVFGWLTLYGFMSFIVPFAGSRGSFFHAAAALQPIWFTAAVVGVDVLVAKARARGRFTPAAFQVFRIALVLFMAILTVSLAQIAIIKNDWNQFRRTYDRVEAILVQNGAQPADVVIVANSPGYYAASGRSAIIVPDENLESVRALADQFGAKYLVLEKTYYTDPMIPVYKNPDVQPGLNYLGEFDDVRIFAFTH
ncbi:MAG: hypothetical protein NTW32_25165 [Chloroflexi bacterium]|nr:hypothetical protein [Chloroflexota bacterium]